MATASQPSPDEDIQSGSPLGSQGSVEDPDSFDLAGHHPTRDTLAEGIVSLLSPTLKTLDEGVLATKRSQEDLSEQIALLTEQLQSIAAEQSCPIDLNGYVTRLGDIKGKINVISSVLHSAQDRLNKVHEQAIKEATRRKPLVEPSPSLTPQVRIFSEGGHPSTNERDRDKIENPKETEDSSVTESIGGEPITQSPLSDPLTDSSSSSG